MKKALLILSFVLLTNVLTAIAQNKSDVLGSWQSGDVGLLGYRSQMTGAVKSNRGSLFTYKFLANGNYEFIGYMESTMYNCTTTLFNEIKGKYTVEGSAIKLSPTRDFWKSGNTCAASGNKEQTKTPKKETVEFRTKTDEYNKDYLCITTASGETCYRREKE
jgi:hypothetical protein